jgi:DNA (cytosine-5)-methyltransferase 1
MSEIKDFPCAVLRYRFPDTMLLGDMVSLIECPVPCDILVGGTPCQSFSQAGKRLGLDDARGNLALVYVMILYAIDAANAEIGKAPCTCLWENVPGVLNTHDNAFGCFLGALVGQGIPLLSPRGDGRWPHSGYVVGPQRLAAWRMLDAQYFGVPQRRKRIFVVASAREGFDPLKILFEPEGLQRDTKPSREAGERTAGSLTERIGHGGTNNEGNDGPLAANPLGSSDALLCFDPRQIHHPANHSRPKPGDPSHPLRGVANAEPAIAFGWQKSSRQGDSSSTITTPTLDKSKTPAVAEASGVRRLTPLECERLQGLPDNWTWIPTARAARLAAAELAFIRERWPEMPLKDAERLASDGPRYAAIGNGFAIPVVRWIAERLAKEIESA